MKRPVLTIAGSDPTGGAGLQADLAVFGALGVHGMAVPSAITVQSTLGVKEVDPIDDKLIRTQLEYLLEDVNPYALKTGLLPTPKAVEAVAWAVREFGLQNLVVDPVGVSSSGLMMASDDTPEAIAKLLFPIATVITPNIREAEVFTGMDIKNIDDMREAASELWQTGPIAVIITGGHLSERAVDLFYDGERFYELDSDKVEGEFHGTGCAFSAALAVGLALDYAPLEAARRAKAYISRAIAGATRPGGGMGILNFFA